MGEAILTAGNTRKYDIPLAHLDYGYVKSCSNVKELEKILKILRSGDEGCFPELELLTETRITELAPESRILRKEKPASRLSDLDSVSKSSIQEDIESWNLQMRGKEEELLTSGSGVVEGDHDLPPIRSGVIGASTSKKAEETKKSNKRVMPRDYREWDKVDVDKELEKVEAEEEEKKKEREKGGGMNANGLPDVDVNISAKGLTEEEKLMKANREKDKGNEAYRSGDYEESVLYYSRSLSLLPTTASYNNRALAYLKMSDWDRSLADLQRVLKDEPDNIKGLLRRGTAHKGRKDFQRAEQDFKKVLDLEPTNKRAKDLLTEIEEDLKKVDKEKTEKKAKGRRMVIEEVEGSESEGETQPMNGHGPEGENTTKSEVEEKSETKEVKTETNVKEEMKNGKDIWTEEDVNSKDVGSKDETVNSDTVEKEMSSKSDTSDHTYSKQEPCESTTEAPADETEESESSIHTRPVFHKQPLPADIAALREQGNNLFRTGQYAEALEKYEEAINLLDSQSEGHEVSLSLLYSNQAACKLKTGDCSSAIADCTMALDLLPHSIKPLLRRASAFEMKEKYKKAYTDYKHILSMDSSVDQAHQGATRCQRHLKEVHGSKWRKALPPLVPVFPWEIPVIIDPSAPQLSTPRAHPGPQVIPKAPTPSTSQDSSTVTASPGKEVSHSAKTSSEPAEQTKKSSEKVETPQEKFDRCKGKGNDHVKKSEFRQAVDCYTECVETLPDIAAAYTNRALCYIRLNQAAEALRDCDKALTLEPENTKALYRRAQAKKMLEQYKDSLADLLQLLRLEPNNKAAKGEVEIVKKYYKAEFEKTKMEAKSTKEAPSKQRKKMKIVEVDDEEDDSSTKTAKTPSQASTKSKSTPSTTTTTSSSSSATTPSHHAPASTGKKSRKSKSKSKSTSGTGLPVAPPSVPKLEKATPYEFLQAWNSLKSSSSIDSFTELVLQVPPQDLPKLISNKLDGQMLHKMIGCVKQIVAKGDVEKGYSILKHLCQVERFNVIQMFMSAEEKKEIGNICGSLSRHKNSTYSDQDVTKLKKCYAS